MGWESYLCLGWLVVSFALVIFAVVGAGLATKTEDIMDGDDE